LQFEIDEPAIAAAGASLDQPIAVTVEKAKLQDLLERIFDGTGLAFRIEGSTVRVTPAPQAN
jgi:hypothetical protein